MATTVTPERALELAKELWPWAKYIACDANWITKVFGEKPEFHYPHWVIRGVLVASVGSNVQWPQEKIEDRLMQAEAEVTS